jgi:hypothetical protein
MNYNKHKKMLNLKICNNRKVIKLIIILVTKISIKIIMKTTIIY